MSYNLTTFRKALSGFDGIVQSCILDATGTYLYCGGAFTSYRGVARQRVAKIHIPTQTLDATFDSASGFDSTVYALALDGSGNLYCGGSFTTYKGTTRQYIAKINGSTAALDATFDSASGFNGTVWSFALDGSGNLYCGGAFTTYKGTTRQCIAKLNGSTAALDATFDSASGFGSVVYSIALDGSGNLYCGGNFTTYKGTTRQYIAKLNRSTAALDATFDSASGFGGTVYSIALDGSSNLYCGGGFTTYKGTTRQRVAKLNGSTAALDATFDSASGFDNVVYAFALDGSGNLYCGGAFTTYKGTTRQRVAKLNRSTAALDATFDSASGFDSTVWSFALDGSGNLYCGGAFTTYSRESPLRVAKLDSFGRAIVGENLFNGFNAAVYSIYVSGDYAYCGGAFTAYKGRFCAKVAKIHIPTQTLDATFDSASGFDSTVYSIALDGSGNLYCGGAFTTYKGTTRQYIAKLNGSTAALDATFDSASGFNNVVYAFALDGSGNLYCGGGFATYKGTTRQCIAKLNRSTAALDATFGSFAVVTSGGATQSLALYGSTLLSGGLYSKYGSTTMSGLVYIYSTTGNYVPSTL